MAIITLITPYEVILNSPAGKDYPTDKICQLIPDIEQEFGYECLGETLYEWLLEHRSSYPSSAQEWVCGMNYEEGETVIRFGCVFESSTDMNNADPADDETESWISPSRFDDDCANEFWADCLKRVLALKIYTASINITTRKAGANGLTVLEGGGAYAGQGFRTSSKSELSDYREDLNKQTETAVRNMERWIIKRVQSDQDCDVPFSTFPACNKLCAPDNPARRRWGFKY